jgi:hypothetical protein
MMSVLGGGQGWRGASQLFWPIVHFSGIAAFSVGGAALRPCELAGFAL